MIFGPELVLTGFDAETAEQAIGALCTLMEAKGLVKDSYRTAVIEREKEYPTGIPTAFYDVAIPHAPSDHVLEAGLAIARLNKGVPFFSMGDADEQLKAEIVFLLAVKDPHSQLNMLKGLMGIFEDEDAMMSLKNARDAGEIADIIIKLGLTQEDPV